MKLYFLFILFAAMICTACNNDRINSLKSEIDFKNSQILSCRDNLSQINSYLGILSSQKEELRSQCVERNDSIKSFIREYPFATAYIYRFDRELPLDILQDYLDAANEDERSAILLGDLAMIFYYNMDHNRDTVNFARQKLNDFNQRSRTALENINSLIENIDDCTNKIEKINNTITSFQHDIKLLNDTLKQYE